MKFLLIFILSNIIQYNCYSQNSIDPYFISNEFNKQRFIAENNIGAYRGTIKLKNTTLIKEVTFNNWSSISKIKESVYYNPKRKNRHYYPKSDSMVVLSDFVYNKDNWKLEKIISQEITYLKQNIERDFRTHLFSYDNENRIKTYVKTDSSKNSKHYKKLIFNYRDSVIVTDYIRIEQIEVSGNLFIDTTTISHPLIIDSILLSKPQNSVYTICKLKLQVFINKNIEWIENHYGQIVSACLVDRNEHSQGSPNEKRARPNPICDKYIYDNDTYLLKVIEYGDGEIKKFKYFKKSD